MVARGGMSCLGFVWGGGWVGGLRVWRSWWVGGWFTYLVCEFLALFEKNLINESAMGGWVGGWVGGWFSTYLVCEFLALFEEDFVDDGGKVGKNGCLVGVLEEFEGEACETRPDCDHEVEVELEDTLF